MLVLFLDEWNGISRSIDDPYLPTRKFKLSYLKHGDSDSIKQCFVRDEITGTGDDLDWFCGGGGLAIT